MSTRKILILVAGTLLAACSQPPPRAASTEPPSTPAPAASPAMSAPPSLAPGQTPATVHAALRTDFERCVEAAAGITPATQACIETEATYQQARLTKALARARTRAGAGPARTALDREQGDWRARTDRDCAWDAATEGQGQRLDANMCDLQAVADRADALERRGGDRE